MPELNLQTYMDGKAGAEELVMKLLKDKSLLTTLASAPKAKQSAVDTPQ